VLIGMLKNTPTSDNREQTDNRKLVYQNKIFSNGGIIQRDLLEIKHRKEANLQFKDNVV